MPTPRKRLISLVDTPYYHCISRCVRQSYLCGTDSSGRSYEHRRGWVEERLLLLASVFAIDICAYAVMSNHTHVVLHVDKQKAQSWDDKHVLTQWHKLYKGTLLTQKYLRGEALTPTEGMTLADTVTQYRKRLYDISWFMRSLNEYIAREANKEDDCTGRFWEGRFTSQALLDEKAVLACMAYVDLNPIRAKMADTPETSRYTSIRRRIQAIKTNQNQPECLMGFVGSEGGDIPNGIAFSLVDYLGLVDDTGKAIREDKRGHIEQSASILMILGLSDQQWLMLTQRLEQHFFCAVGNEQSLRAFAQHINQHRVKGVGSARRLLRYG